MPFLTQGKTNWKFLLIVGILTVVVGGGTIWLVKEQEAQFAKLPEINIPERVQGETADWQTYRNEEYGFEVKYPKEFGSLEVTESIMNEETSDCVKGEQASLVFETPIRPGSSIYRFDISLISADYEPLEFNSKDETYCYPYYPPAVTEGIIIDSSLPLSSTFLRATGPIQDLSCSIFQKAEFSIAEYNKKYSTFEISSPVATVPLLGEGQVENWKTEATKFLETNINELAFQMKQFDLITKSVKFFPVDETANWKTYKNEEYGYQIKYPKDWIIQKNILGAFDIYKSFYDYNCSVEVYADTLEYLYPIEEAEGYFQPFSESKISTKEEVAFIRDISGKKLLSPELAGREIYFFKEEVKNLVGRSQYYYFNIFLDVYKQDPHGEPIIKENKCKDVFKEILSTFQFTKEKTIVDRIPDATCVYRKGEYEMRFYDLQGRMTGIKDGEIKEEIPGSYYIPRDLNSPLDCPPNCYKIGIPDYVSIHKVEIFGIKEGNYKVVGNAIGPAGEEPVTFSAMNIPIISGLTHVYIVEWEILARGEEGVVIFIDLDGDGIFEKSITSDKTLSCEEFIIQLKKS